MSVCFSLCHLSCKIELNLGHYYLRKGGYVFAPVRLLVCWFVSKITQKLLISIKLMLCSQQTSHYCGRII